MRIRATALTAFLTGCVMAIVLTIGKQNWLQSLLNSSPSPIMPMIGILAFFAIMIIFVLGTQQTAKDFRSTAKRMVAWGIGALTGAMAAHFLSSFIREEREGKCNIFIVNSRQRIGGVE